MTLVEALDAAADDLPGVTRNVREDAVEWSVGGRPFTAAAGNVADFRLAGVVASAALGTPDTSPSRRGRDWISFAPPELDRLAVDRATAWLASAYRNATAPRG